MATDETTDISAKESPTTLADESGEMSSDDASETKKNMPDTSANPPAEKTNTEVESQLPLTTLDPELTDPPAPPTTTADAQTTSSATAKGIPVLNELHSSDSASSSTEGEDDFMIPNFDLLEDSTGADGTSISSNRRNQETDDPQILQRRDRNKKAASACRQRQKEKAEELEKEVSKLQTEQVRYKRQIQRVQEMIRTYKAIYKQHLPRCRLLAESIRRHKLAVASRTQRTAATMRQNSGTFVPAMSLEL